jgi:hypothetical protein
MMTSMILVVAAPDRKRQAHRLQIPNRVDFGEKLAHLCADSRLERWRLARGSRPASLPLRPQRSAHGRRVIVLGKTYDHQKIFSPVARNAVVKKRLPL